MIVREMEGELFDYMHEFGYLNGLTDNEEAILDAIGKAISDVEEAVEQDDRLNWLFSGFTYYFDEDRAVRDIREYLKGAN